MTRIKPGRYRHFKGGEYEVIGVGNHTETSQELVVYKALYGENRIWMRPIDMFEGTKIIEGKEVPRFQYIE